MANGLNSIVKRRGGDGNNGGDATKMGSRRIFTPHFKLQVLDSYRQDADCKGNQRATARKYGIHRRQIQKWLQAENSLRGSVQQHHHSVGTGRGKREDGAGEAYDVRRAVTLDCGRQGGAVVSSAISRDCWTTTTTTTDCMTTISPPLPVPAVDFMSDRLCIASSPMDLSVKKFPTPDAIAANTDVSSILVRPEAIAVSERLCHDDVNTQSGEILDLTCRKRKFCDASEVSSSTEAVPVANPERAEAPPPAKDVKLFKPYLLCDDDKDTASRTDHKMAAVAFPKAAAVVTAAVDLFPGKYDAWHMNNNILTNSIIYPMDCYGYNYQYYPSSQHEQQIRYSPCYDSASSFSPSSCCDDDYPSLSPDYDAMSVRQRQSYSVDFKLSAIDSYYHDMECRGNQRAVASKFCIHRRQIQKWLKQEDILRQRLQTSPPLT